MKTDIFLNPWTQMGMGILAANKPGASAGQAIGQGGLLGMQNYRQMLNENKQNERLEKRDAWADEDREWQDLDRMRLEAERKKMIDQFPEIAGLPRHVQDEMLKQKFGTGANQTYGNTPLYFRDETGALKMGRMAPGGGVHLPDLQGLQPVRPMSFQDLGGGVAAMPYGSALPETMLPKTLSPQDQPAVRQQQAAASSFGAGIGTKDAESINDLDRAVTQSMQTVQLIDDMLSHPGLEYAIGASSMLPIIPGTPAADFDAKAKQIEGKLFLEAFETLKGGGQITQIEGDKATAAMGRLGRAQTEKEYKASLRELKNILQRGVARAKSSASNASSRQGRQSAPQSQSTGGSFDGFKIVE